MKGPRRGRSEVVAPQGERHAARSTAAAHQLAAFDRNHRPLAIIQRRAGRHHTKAGTGKLAEGGVVAVVAQDDAGPYRERVAGRRPLLALLQGPLIAAAEDRLERLIHRLHRGKEVWHFFDTLRPFTAVGGGPAVGGDERRRGGGGQAPGPPPEKKNPNGWRGGR